MPESIIRVSPDVMFRWELANLANARGLTGTAVELGVNRGEFAANFLARWEGKRYIAVDHYLPYPDMPNPRAQDRDVAHAMLARFGNRVEWQELDTVLALEAMEPESVDALYTDAFHALWAVQKELDVGWTRVRPGGMFAGHDFDYHCGDVCYAVRSFAAKHGLEVFLTQDGDSPWSWYTFKPEAACGS